MATKTPISLTPRAEAEIKSLLQRQPLPQGFGLRIGARGGGCSGLSYVFGFDQQREHDYRFEINDIPMLLDKRQGLYLLNTTVDYHDGLQARGFVFENPNAAKKCGCGSSFSV